MRIETVVQIGQALTSIGSLKASRGISERRGVRNATPTTAAIPSAPATSDQRQTRGDTRFPRRSLRRDSEVDFGQPAPSQYLQKSQSQSAVVGRTQGTAGRSLRLPTRKTAGGSPPTAATR